MARETKVGLLAGLAFIICFAIILANRGRRSPESLHQPYMVDAGNRTRTALDGAPTRRKAALPRSPKPTRSSPLKTKRGTGRLDENVHRAADRVASGRRREPTTPAPGPDSGSALLFPSGVGNGGMGRAVSNVARGSSTQRNPKQGDRTRASDVSKLSAMTTPVTGGGLRNPSSTQLQKQRILQRRLEQLAKNRRRHDDRADAPSPKPVSVSQVPSRSPAASVRPQSKRSPAPDYYTVGPGDTLSRIARRRYHQASPAVIDAIFKINRKTLSSPDMLKVGMKLVLPSLDGLGPRPIVAQSGTAGPRRRVTEKSKPATAAVRWYQIKKNDRYISIARRELGDARRWREIYELNKEKFPDPSRIREGVRIKLPGTVVADSRMHRP